MNGQQPQLKKPVDWDELYPGRFLKAGQLGERRPTLTIKSVDVERLPDEKGGEKVKGVITFVEVPYQLAMNKTNGLCLRELFGRNLDQWVGRKVTLYRGQVESGSQKGEPAVRVWGSPELTHDREVEVRLPRKRPMHMTMHAVKQRSQDQKVDRHPTEGGTTVSSPQVGNTDSSTQGGTTVPGGGDRPPF